VPLAPPPPPPSSPAPAGAAHERRRGQARWLGAAIVVLLVAAGVTAVAKAGDDEPAHPSRWDPRVADLAAFVERDRGLQFDHPVEVDFLSREDYRKLVTTDADELGDDDLKDLDEQSSVLRALGVASGKLDLAAALNDESDSGTLAFYDPSDKRVHVRGTKVTVGLKVTLVHELTHALQDQHFDLDDLLDDADDDGQATARRALAEGDATRIEDDYVDSELSDADQQAYDDEHQGEVDQSEIGTADVPDFVQATFAAPYALGSPFVTMLVDKGGNKEVDRAFRHPPSTEEHLFDPVSFLAGERAKAPKLGLKVDDDESGVLGPPTWYLVLGQRIDADQALDAALGWDGDTYGQFRLDGRTCIRAVFRGDTERDEDEMGAAIDAWAPKVPGGHAQRVDVAGHPGLEACDPGPDLDLGVAPISSKLLAVPATLGYLEADAAQVLPPAEARCYATTVLHGIGYERLSSDDQDEQDRVIDEIRDRAGPAIARCRTLPDGSPS
jgi:hypothetical protein